MAVPYGFIDEEHYFKEVVKFLDLNSWIFQHNNTKVLQKKVIKGFPKGFANYFLNVGNTDLNKFPYVQEPMLIECKKLAKFRRDVKRLIPNTLYMEYPHKEHLRGVEHLGQLKMSSKKQYEINKLSQIICDLCDKTCDCLVDLGSGKGYLSEAIHSRNDKMPILGLEMDEERVEKARERRNKFLKKSAKTYLKYQYHEVTNLSMKFIEEHTKSLIAQFNPIPPVIMRIGMIGLHACGDLSVHAIRFFLNTASIRRLIIMPCCYHKMELENDIAFKNFPLSRTLLEIFLKYRKFDEKFNRPFMRLACQESIYKWVNQTAEEHLFHSEQMYYRALADAIVYQKEEVVEPVKPLCARELKERGLPKDFDTFTRHWQVFDRKLAGTHWSPWHQGRFYSLNRRYGTTKGPRLMEGLTCLQMTLQRVCENLVLLDRLVYMKEMAGIKDLRLNIRYEKIFDDNISPRCWVLIAEKV